MKRNIGMWLSDKKSQKLNWNELIKAFNTRNYNLIKLDPDIPLEEQGDLNIFLHKLTDIIAAAEQGEPKALNVISRVEQYLSNHPNIRVIDPLEKVKILINRNCYYKLLQEKLTHNGIFIPNFAEFTTNNIENNMQIMRERGVTFPVICKPTIAHGSKLAHEMIVVFNEKGLSVCKPPCVVQSFVNHNAVFHKVFLVGNRYHICERPSLKNFYASEDLEPIFYSTGEVCKADSQSTLSILDPHDRADFCMTLDEVKVRHIIKVLRKEIGLLLMGFDVVLDNVTGDHAVIDINVFPSYDNFPNFFEHLLDCLDATEMSKSIDVSKLSNGDCIEDFEESSCNGLLNVGLQPRIGVCGMYIN